MPYTIDFMEGNKIVTVQNTGKLTYNDFVQESTEALQLAKEKNTNLFLVDNVKLIAQASIVELFDFPDMYERIGAPKTIKVAVLIAENTLARNEVRFYENVCYNRGWRVRVFTGYDTAIHWLQSKEG